MSEQEQIVSEGVLSVLEAAKFLGVGRTTIFKLCAEGKLSYVKLGNKRTVPVVELRRLLAASLIGDNSTGNLN